MQINMLTLFLRDFFDSLNTQDVKYCYLRNYEKFPEDIGNDIDVLVKKESLRIFLKILLEKSREYNLKIVNITEHLYISLFLSDLNGFFLHFDIFENITYRFFTLIQGVEILNNRYLSSKKVYVPSIEHELVSSILPRIMVEGELRVRYLDVIKRISEQERVRLIMFGESIVGKAWPELIDKVFSNDVLDKRELLIFRKRFLWKIVFSQRNSLRLAYSFFVLAGKRFLSPSGLFMVFEGVDGAGKTTIIQTLKNTIKGLTGRNNSKIFHWKPIKSNFREFDSELALAQNPRSFKCRSLLGSSFYLVYHILSFWMGYVVNIKNVLMCNRFVIGDRYVYDLFFDPKRFRISFPENLIKVFIRIIPSPHILFLCEVLPEIAISRKKELDETEIESYQHRMFSLNFNKTLTIKLDCNKEIKEISEKVKMVILDYKSTETLKKIELLIK